jgi:hypothetical protein
MMKGAAEQSSLDQVLSLISSFPEASVTVSATPDFFRLHAPHKARIPNRTIIAVMTRFPNAS